VAANEIQVGRFNGILHKLLDMKEAAPAPSLAPDIFACLTLETDRPEWAFLGAVRLCSASGDQAAGAGAVSIFQLSNPAGSGVIIVLESVNIWTVTTQLIYTHIASSSTGLPTTISTFFRDPRWGAPAAGAPAGLVTSSNATSAFGNIIHRQQCPSTQSFGLELPPVVLVPNSSIQFAGAAVNIRTACSIHWRERHLEPSELR